MTVALALNWSSVLTGLVAAIFWFASAAVKLPSRITVGYAEAAALSKNLVTLCVDKVV